MLLALQFPALLIFAGLSFLIGVYCSIRVIEFRHHRSVRAILILIGSVSLWLLSQFLMLIVAKDESAIIYFGVSQVVIALVVLAIYHFLSCYTHTHCIENFKQLLWFLIDPALIIILLLTNPLHHLVFRGFDLVAVDRYRIVVPLMGPAMFVHLVYLFSLLGWVHLRLFFGYSSALKAYRNDFRLLSFLLLPLLFSAVFLLRIFPWLQTDWTPILLMGAIVPIALVVFRKFRHFEILPFTYHHLINHLDHGVVILDHLERVMDLNEKAAQAINREIDSTLNQPAAEVLPAWDFFGAAFDSTLPVEQEIVLVHQEALHHYQMEMRLIEIAGKGPGVRLITLKDITRVKSLEAEVDALTPIDLLTGIYNRRQFFLISSISFDQAQRYNMPITVMIVSIPGLKDVEMNYSTEIYEQATLRLVRFMEEGLRRSDVLARFNPSEFIFLLPDTRTEGALTLALRIREHIDGHVFHLYDHDFQFDVQIGIAEADLLDSQVGIQKAIVNAEKGVYQAHTQDDHIYIMRSK